MRTPARVKRWKILDLSSPDVDMTDFVTSWAFSALTLAGIRTVFSVYVFTTIVYSFIYFSRHTTVMTLTDIGLPTVSITQRSNAIGRSFSYFTYLSFWGLGFYFLVGACHGYLYHRKRSTVLNGRGSCRYYLRWFHSLFYTTITTFPFLVTLVYWISMYVHGDGFPTTFTRWGMISVHGINSFFALFEMIVPVTSAPPLVHLACLMIIMTLYLGIAYLSKLTTGIYVYLWLDPQHGWPQIIGHIAGYGALLIIIFVVMVGIIRGRMAVTDRWFGGKGQQARQRTCSMAAIDQVEVPKHRSTM